MYWKRKWVSSTDTSCLVVAHPHQFDGSGMRRDGGGGQDGIIHWLIRYQKGNISIHLHLFKLFFNFNFFLICFFLEDLLIFSNGKSKMKGGGYVERSSIGFKFNLQLRH